MIDVCVLCVFWIYDYYWFFFVVVEVVGFVDVDFVWFCEVKFFYVFFCVFLYGLCIVLCVVWMFGVWVVLV